MNDECTSTAHRPTNILLICFYSIEGTWSGTGIMSTIRYFHTATVLLNGKVLVAGGNDVATLNSAQLYDPSTGMCRLYCR